MENLLEIIEKEIIETNEKRKTIEGLEELILEQKHIISNLKKSLEETCKNIVEEEKILKQFEKEKQELRCKEREIVDKNFREIRQALQREVKDINLPSRYRKLYCSTEKVIVADIVTLSYKDYLRFRNIGKKSIKDLEDCLRKLHPDLKLGMSTDEYNIISRPYLFIYY